ncbi:MAG: hypothetical protein ACREXG_02540 [Polaromonas sp.]
MSTALWNKLGQLYLEAVQADQDARDVTVLSLAFEDIADEKWSEYNYFINLVAWNKFGTW